MKTRRRLTFLAFALAVLSTAPALAEAPAEPDGYRQEDYRAATPATLRGATVLTTPDAQALWQAHSALFIDVLPHAPRPANLPAGTIWRDKPHDSIPGATWLPDVGHGALAAETEAYFKRNLASLTADDHDKALVIFCKKDCWMSWNAAKRALGYGYRHVYWYPDGVDGWSAAALPLVPLEPRP